MQWKTDTYSGWGRVKRAEGQIARPERAAHLRALVAATPAPAMGNRRSYGDACLSDGGRVIDMTRLDRLIAFDPKTGVLEAEAGVTLGDILAVFAPLGWMPAVLPGTAWVTLGGAIANDVHGKNHHDAGSFGASVLSLQLIGPDGVARLVSPRREAAVFRSTIGGLGQTGVIETARIKLIPCPGQAMQVSETRIADLAGFLAALEASTAPYSVGWIDATARGRALGRGILEEGQITDATPAKPAHRPRKIPFNAPRFLLSSPFVRAFNALYLRRVPSAGRVRVRTLAQFFFPLDQITGWNRLYGKRGFLQFQCVVPPKGAAEVLTELLQAISGAGIASPLAVLKRLGSAKSPGLMSFPMEGFTLAVDFAHSARAEALMGKLEALVIASGGRIYLAKDASLGAAAVSAMYPKLPEFAASVRAADPDGRFATDLTRRLNLRGAK